MSKRKWTYWHRCIWVHRDHKKDSTKVGDVVGIDEPTEEWHWHSDKIKGFYVKVKFELLGKLPYNLHETDPAEASRRIVAGEWS